MSYMIRSAGRLQRSTRNGDGGVHRKEGKKDGVIGEFTVSRWFRRRCRYAACTDDVLISPEPGYLASIGTVYLARVLESEVATGKTRLPHPPIPRQPSPLFIFCIVYPADSPSESGGRVVSDRSRSSLSFQEKERTRWLGCSSRVSIEFNLLNVSPAREDALWILRDCLRFCRNREDTSIDRENISSYPATKDKYLTPMRYPWTHRGAKTSPPRQKMDGRWRGNFKSPCFFAGDSPLASYCSLSA